jgi:hypothetical protein
MFGSMRNSYVSPFYSLLTAALLSLSLTSFSSASFSLTVSSRPCTSSSLFRIFTASASSSSCPTTEFLFQPT